jgi:hypothetical protein
MYASVRLSLDFVFATRGQNTYLVITYRAPRKQGGPKNFYIRTFRVLNAIWTSEALLPWVIWLGHEASQSPPSSTDLPFKTVTCIHGVHRDNSSRPELAWNGWVRAQYFWDFLFRRTWSRACQKRCCMMSLLRRKHLSEFHTESTVKKSVIVISFTASVPVWNMFILCYKHWNSMIIVWFDFSGWYFCRLPETGAEPIVTLEGCQRVLAAPCFSTWNPTTLNCKYKSSVTIYF